MASNRLITVKKLVSSRYQSEASGLWSYRPVFWNERLAGFDEIETSEGERLRLFSNRMQSAPGPGWQIILYDYPPLCERVFSENELAAPPTKHSCGAAGDEKLAAYSWTLYGLEPGAT